MCVCASGRRCRCDLHSGEVLARVRDGSAIGIHRQRVDCERVGDGAAVVICSQNVVPCHLRSCHVAMLFRVMSRPVLSRCVVSRRNGGRNTLTQLPHSHTTHAHAARTHTDHIYTTRVRTAYTRTTHTDAPAQFYLPAIASAISSAPLRLLLKLEMWG